MSDARVPADELRLRYRPEPVDVLFVGESPPAGGTFFYAANSKLYFATKRAFEQALDDLLGDDFLVSFCALGCYLDDLCTRPVNHLKLAIREERRERLDERRAGEAALTRRMREMNPSAIVLVMSGIEENVRCAAAAAGLGDRVEAVLPFPGRPEHAARFDRDLQRSLRQLRAAAIFVRPSGS